MRACSCEANLEDESAALSFSGNPFFGSFLVALVSKLLLSVVPPPVIPWLVHGTQGAAGARASMRCTASLLAGALEPAERWVLSTEA